VLLLLVYLELFVFARISGSSLEVLLLLIVVKTSLNLCLITCEAWRL
jgi:hypothetical protein